MTTSPDGSTAAVKPEDGSGMQRRALLAAAGGLAAGLALNRTASAGPLNPPAGPVTSTGKTLSEVEPRIAINATNTPGDATSLFRITQPGSYYLTGNITGVSGKHGIAIAAGGVTVDLMGFDLLGVPGSLDGVSATASNANIAVVNGSIRSWGGKGVDFASFPAVINCRLADLRVRGNTGVGIRSGAATEITRCVASLNGGFGISTFGACSITECIAFQNNGSGISAGSGCTISRCTLEGNTNHGVTTGDSCTIAGCTSHANSQDGIRITSGCLVRENNCDANGWLTGDGAGVHATGTDNRIEANNCAFADRGIDVDSPGNLIIRNTCSGNTTNWDIVANNVVGPILDRSNPGSAAILGNSAPDSTGSTHPNANFTY